MKNALKVLLAVVAPLTLVSCAHTNQSKPNAAKVSKSNQAKSVAKNDKAFENPFLKKDDDDGMQKTIIDKLEKEKTELELQNAILMKALNERKKVVHKLPKGEVVQQFPEFEELIFDQAKTAYQEQDQERLEEAVRILRANQPSSHRLEVMFFWLAKVQEGKELNSQALVTYNEFIKMFPDSKYIPQALFLKGKLYEKLNLKPQAMKIYADIRKLHPDSREKHFADAKLRENNELSPKKVSKNNTEAKPKKEIKRK